jgi:hypothetical protein
VTTPTRDEVLTAIEKFCADSSFRAGRGGCVGLCSAFHGAMRNREGWSTAYVRVPAMLRAMGGVSNRGGYYWHFTKHGHNQRALMLAFLLTLSEDDDADTYGI